MNAPSIPPILLPRPAGRADRLIELLQDSGYRVDHYPFIELTLEHDSDMRDAVRELAAGAFTHLVLTSITAVEALAWFDDDNSKGASFSVPEGTEVWAVGESTADALREHGIAPHLVADGSGAALVNAAPTATSGARVLFPASAAAAPTVPEGLRAKGYQIQQEIAYRPRSASVSKRVVLDLRVGNYSAIVLTSAMIATLAGHLGIHTSTKVVTIGAPTTKAAEDQGLTVHRQADYPNDDSLAAAVREVLSAQ